MREIIRGPDGQWYCDDMPVAVELRTLGLDEVVASEMDINLEVASDEHDALVVTVRDGVIVKAAIKDAEVETTLGGFVLHGRSYADKFFLTGTAEEQATAREKLMLDHFGEDAERPGFMPNPEPTVHHPIVEATDDERD